MATLVRLESDDRVATITLDSQSNRNALSRQLLAELHQCIDAAEAEDARIIVLRHEGPAFCSGADLKERSVAGPVDSTPMVRAMQRLMHTNRPTIAAVEGAVRAGGIGLMAACDLVVAQTTVSFALTEVRVGVAPAIISVPILDRVLASKIAGPMLTGEPFDSARALEMGLITHVSDHVDTTLASLCEGILAGAPQAVASTKRLLRRIPHLPNDEAFVEMQAFSDALFATAEAAEGMAAFIEKRPPVWD